MNLLQERKKLSRTPTHLQAHFIFFPTQKPSQKNKKSLQANAQDSADIRANLTRHTFGRKEARTDNSGFKKLAVRWLNQVQFSNQIFVVADSFVLRNRQLLKPAKR